jgi:hypothetical protein
VEVVSGISRAHTCALPNPKGVRIGEKWICPQCQTNYYKWPPPPSTRQRWLVGFDGNWSLVPVWPRDWWQVAPMATVVVGCGMLMALMAFVSVVLFGNRNGPAVATLGILIAILGLVWGMTSQHRN